jgi:hypothetical protein
VIVVTAPPPSEIPNVGKPHEETKNIEDGDLMVRTGQRVVLPQPSSRSIASSEMLIKDTDSSDYQQEMLKVTMQGMQKLDTELETLVNFVRKGVVMKKYNRIGRYKERNIWIPKTLDAVQWGLVDGNTGRIKGALWMKDISGVVDGNFVVVSW